MAGKRVSLVGEIHIGTGSTYTDVDALEALKVIGMAYGLYDHAEELRDCRVILQEGEHPALVVQGDVSCHGRPLWETVRTVTDDPKHIQRYMAFRDTVKMVRQIEMEMEHPAASRQSEKGPQTMVPGSPAMGQKEFQACVAHILGEIDPAATKNWLQYAEELDQSGTESMGVFFDEMCGELQQIRGIYGAEIARQLYRCGQTFTFAPFELRTAAEHLKAGMPINEITKLAVDGDFFTSPERYCTPAVHMPKKEGKKDHER